MLFFVLWTEWSDTFKVKTSPDNEENFGQKMSHSERSIWVCSVSSWGAHAWEFVAFAALATLKQSVNSQAKPESSFFQVFYLCLFPPFAYQLEWRNWMHSLVALWPRWTAASSSWPWIKNRLSRRRSRCQTSLIMRRDRREKSVNQFTLKGR